MESVPVSIGIPKHFYTDDVQDKFLEYKEAAGYRRPVAISLVHGCVYLDDDEPVFRKVSELEEWLVQQRIPFDRYTSAYCDWPALKRMYRPGCNGTPSIDVEVKQVDGDDYIPAVELKRCLALPDNEVLDAVHQLVQTLTPDVVSLQEISYECIAGVDNTL